MLDHHGRAHLDGGWWPQSRDLEVELADLVDHFPSRLGRIVRALVSPPDWERSARRIRVVGGFLKVGSFPRDDTHLITIKTSDRAVLRILVVPPDFSAAQGHAAMHAAATPGNVYSAAAILNSVTALPESPALDHWSDDGGWGRA